MALILFENTPVQNLFPFSQIIKHEIHEPLKNLFLLMIFKLIVINLIDFIIKIGHLSLVHIII